MFITPVNLPSNGLRVVSSCSVSWGTCIAALEFLADDAQAAATDTADFNAYDDKHRKGESIALLDCV